jgi:transglutaminase-like putative cysteine protease
MFLRVFHQTHYRYVARVAESHNEAKLRPMNAPCQRCLEYNLEVEPAAWFSDYTDFYGNASTHFHITQPHLELVVTARSLVETFAPSFNEPRGLFSPAELQPVLSRESLYEFLMDSHYVTRDARLWKCAREIRGEVRDLKTAARRLMHWIFSTFTYQPETTQVRTSALEAFELRSGVCQDFAHVMLGLCRVLEIPARYVSGYFYDEPRPGIAPAPSAGASHAWVEVYLPGYGWYGLDPTHNRPANPTYIKLAIGRDYNDIRPISGTYRGVDLESMEVQVSIQEETAPPGFQIESEEPQWCPA